MSLKRANGTGSVYKMKHKKLRKPYRAVVTIGWTDDGKSIRKSIGTFRTGKEALEAIQQYCDNPTAFEKKKITFGTCWDWMIADKQRKGISQSTMSNYRTAGNRLQDIMNTPIESIRLAHLQAIIDDNLNLSRSTIDKIVIAIGATFDTAIKNDIPVKNYANYIVRPTEEKSTIHQPYTPEEIYALWRSTAPEDAIKLIYIYTGMRPSELPLTKIEDIHIAEGYLIGGVKTKAGKNRIIPIASCIRPFVSDLLNLARFKRATTLKAVLPNYSAMHKHWKQDKHLPHDGRHTFATMAANIGMDRHVIKLIMGHSTGSDIPESVYMHKTIKQLVDAVELLPHHEELVKVEQRLSNS